MGEVFAGRFELLSPIADGGMGSVWQVRDLRDSQVYAGKLLRQSDSASLLRFMREQGTRIHHRHVVTPLSWAGEDDRVMFTMPLVRGGSVATLLADHGRLPGHWVVELLSQSLDALSAIHEQRLVHRDLKPANLLLEATGNARPVVRVTDFGLATSLDEPRLTRASIVLGTPGYMSPEQLRGADPDPSQDLFAIGRCGLEMLTRAKPEESVNAARRRAVEEPELAELVELLITAASADPARRPTTAQVLRNQLQVLPAIPSHGAEPFVRDQLGGDAPLPTLAATPASPHPSGPREAGEPLVEKGNQSPASAYLLFVLAAVLAAGAVWLLLG